MAGKLTLAKRLAEVTGKSVDEAFHFVGKVGTSKTEDALRAAENGISWKLPTLAVAGGGTALAWNEQEARTAEALAEEAGASADQSANASDMLALLIESEGDIPAELRNKLLEQFGENYDGGGGGDGGDDEDNSEGGFFADLFGEGGLDALGGSLQQTVILLVVVLVVLNWALARSSTIGMPTVAAGGGR